MSGSGLSAADRNKKIRQEALREQLSKQKLIEKVIDINGKIQDLAQELPPEHVARLKIAMDVNLKLINKYLPDLRQTELVGDPENPLEHRVSVWNLVGVPANGN
jgi:hypothetical protein